MSFINWSDPEEMVGLLAEYVADERLAENEDSVRARFLDELTSALMALATHAEDTPTRDLVDRLRDIYDLQGPESGADPVLIHLNDCIEELERIMAQRDGTLSQMHWPA